MKDLPAFKSVCGAYALTAVTDAAGVITDADTGFCKLSGYTKKQLCGQSYAIFNSGFHPKKFYAGIVKAVKAGKVWQGQIKGKAKKGGFFWVDISIIPFANPKGQAAAYLAVMKDITERKESEEKLYEEAGYLNTRLNATSKELNTLFENINEVFFSIDLVQNRFVQISASCFKLAGHRPAEFMKQPRLWIDMVHPDDRARLAATRKSRIASGKEFVERFRIMHKKEGLRWAETRARATLNADGAPVRLDGIIKDVTGEIKAEETLVNSEKRFRALIENNKDIIALISPDQKVIYRSPSFSAVLGYAPEELDGQPLFGAKHPDDVANLERLMTYLYKNPGASATAEWRHKHKDGTWRWMEGTATNLLNDPAVKAIVCNYRDVTQRKKIQLDLEEAARNLDNVFSRINEGIFSMDTETRGYVHYSAGMEKIYGYSVDDFRANPKLWDEMVYPEDRPIIIGANQKLWKGEAVTVQARIYRKDGSLRWVEWKIVPTTNAGGKLSKLDGTVTDVTEKKETELKLETALSDLNHVLNSVDEGLFSMDTVTWKYIQISAGCAKIYGYPLEDFYINGKLWMEVIYPPDRDFVEATNANLYRGKPVRVDYRIVHKNGSLRWIEAKMNPELNAKGELVRIDGIVIDITGKKETELKLESTLANLNAIFNNVDEGLFSMDVPNWRCTQISAGCEKIFGYTVDEFYADPSLWLKSIHPDDIPVGVPHQQKLLHGGSTIFECRIIRKDKTMRWAETKAIPQMDATGKVLLRVDGFIHDITARKEAEEKLRYSQQRFQSLIERSSDVIFLLNNEYRLTYFSPSMKTVLDYEPGEVLGQKVQVVIHPDDVKRVEQILDKLSKDDGGTAMLEIRVQHKNRSWRWIEVSVSNQFSVPAVNALVVNFRDITERKKAKEEIEALNLSLEKKVEERTEQLHEANKALESFSYSVAHDLQAPLRILTGYARVLEEDYKNKFDDAGKQLMQVMAHNARLMSKLITDLLNFSKVTRAAIKSEPVNFDALLKEVLETLKQDDEEMQTEFRIQSLGYCNCDGNLIKQVWLNLLSNAIKYSRKSEHPLVEVGCEMQGDKKVFYVRDNGVGFDNRHAARLFDVFFRLHKSEDYEGTGVGLALAYNIISRHGGKIWAQGEVGKGATFRFYLPEQV